MTTMDDFIRNNDEEVILKGFELGVSEIAMKTVESPYASAVVQNNCIGVVIP
jgi:hypothetical protein